MRIAISGAGIAGPTLAWWLLRGGHEPTLIETAPALRTGGYVIDFWGLGYTVAERMGLMPAVEAAGYHVEEVRFVDGRGRTAGGFSTEIFSKPLAGRFISLPRGDLAAAIAASLGGRAEILFDTTVEALEARQDGVRLSLSRGADRDFDLVVGADGLHSKVRELAFGPQARFERRLGYWVAAFEIAGYRPRDELVYVSYGRAGRQISRFAMAGDRTLILLVFTEDRLEGPPPGDLAGRKAALSRVFAGAGWEWPAIEAALAAADDLYFDPVSQIVMDRWTDGRVALVGDAAACVSLLAGEGTGLAMTEAYVLAGELQAAGADHAAAFAAYESKLRDFLARKQKAARGFASSFAPRTALGVWLRNKATLLMGVPAIADALGLGALKDDLALPDYSIAPPA